SPPRRSGWATAPRRPARMRGACEARRRLATGPFTASTPFRHQPSGGREGLSTLSSSQRRSDRESRVPRPFWPRGPSRRAPTRSRTTCVALLQRSPLPSLTLLLGQRRQRGSSDLLEPLGVQHAVGEDLTCRQPEPDRRRARTGEVRAKQSLGLL